MSKVPMVAIESPGVKRIICLASGRGSNFRAVVDAMETGQLPHAKMAALITDRPGTGAEVFADAHAIPIHIIEYVRYAEREEYDRVLKRTIEDIKPDLILALGYMRILNKDLVDAYAGRIMNIHPALLPAFPGLHAQKQALAYGVKISGATVHYMDAGVDTGPIIVQVAVNVPNDADESELKELILNEEHRIIVEAVRLHCADRLILEERTVRILKEKEK